MKRRRLGLEELLFDIPAPSQTIQPWQFGHPETKATCLWLRGLPRLTPTHIVEGREARVHREPPGPERWRNRSRTYQGIAAAMADSGAPPERETAALGGRRAQLGTERVAVGEPRGQASYLKERETRVRNAATFPSSTFMSSFVTGGSVCDGRNGNTHRARTFSPA